jgi:hypothetical protein
MKLRNFRSVVTVAMSDEHKTPLPPAPFAQCSTVPPRKKMSPATDQRHVRDELLGLSIPKLNGWIRTHNPALVSGMKVDRHIAERAAPFHHRGIEVRMRDGDCLQAAKAVDQGNGRGVQHRNAIPQDISSGCANKQRALTNRKVRLCPNADHSRLVLAVRIKMPGSQRCQRGPSLPAGWNVLPLFSADCAPLWRDTARVVLRAARRANERIHLTSPGSPPYAILTINLNPNGTRCVRGASGFAFDQVEQVKK